jgi:hypothetical protein
MQRTCETLAPNRYEENQFAKIFCRNIDPAKVAHTWGPSIIKEALIADKPKGTASPAG